MDDTCTCPKCQMEDAYFDGMIFVCPNCDYEWSDNSKLSTFNTSKDSSIFKKLAELTIPFFKLEQGKLYDCKVHHEKGIEEITIIPLSFKIGKNVTFVIIDARRLLKENPNFVHEIINMDFEYIYDDGIKADYPSEYDALTILCATDDDGTFIDNDGIILYDFVKTSEI